MKLEEVSLVKSQSTGALRLSILLPVRNEVMGLRVMIRLLTAAVEIPHEILVICDSDEDTSIPVVNKLIGKIPNLRLIMNREGSGVANAINAGVNASKGDYVLIFAADELGPIVALDEFIQKMEEGYDVVSCTRYSKGGRRLGGSLIGRILSYTANKIFRLLTNTYFTDCTLGIKMLKKSVYRDLELSNKTVGWGIAFEIAIKAQLRGLKIYEMPITSVDRLYGGYSSFKVWNWTIGYLRWFFWGLYQFYFAKNKNNGQNKQ